MKKWLNFGITKFKKHTATRQMGFEGESFCQQFRQFQQKIELLIN